MSILAQRSGKVWLLSCRVDSGGYWLGQMWSSGCWRRGRRLHVVGGPPAEVSLFVLCLELWPPMPWPTSRIRSSVVVLVLVAPSSTSRPYVTWRGGRWHSEVIGHEWSGGSGECLSMVYRTGFCGYCPKRDWLLPCCHTIQLSEGGLWCSLFWTELGGSHLSRRGLITLLCMSLLTLSIRRRSLPVLILWWYPW